MILSATDQAKYPQFTKYIKLAVPQLISIPVIVLNVSKYGSIDIKEFREVVTWGKGPTLTIKDLHHGQCGVPKAYGCFRHAKPSAVEIHVGTVVDFEKANASHSNTTAKGVAVYVVGATLLHELCHWGNYNNTPRIPEIKEMGAEFEKATYGKIIY